MRVMILADKDSNRTDVVEIVFFGYDDDMTGIKDEDGNYNSLTQKPVSGIFMKDAEGDSWYIGNVSVETHNAICKELLINGFADLTSYGECQYDEYVEDDKK